MGRTISGRKAGSIVYADDVLSPNVLSGMWADCPLLAYMFDPSIGHLYENHFHTYAAADWTITTVEAGGSSATEAITDEVGGVLLVTNDAADNDEDEFQHVGEAFKLVPGKPAWLEGAFKLSDATQSDFLFGLCITDTTLIAGLSDGVYFLKDDGDAYLDWHCEKNSTDTTGVTGVDVADATYIVPGIKWDGEGNVEYWVDGVRRAVSTTNVPDDENLRISFALMNGEAVAKTMSVCRIRAFQILK